jgi:AhpD family alkylhydroperoxidase
LIPLLAAQCLSEKGDCGVVKDGAIPAKYKELMAVAVAITTQCVYCIEFHTQKAKKAGALLKPS